MTFKRSREFSQRVRELSIKSTQVQLTESNLFKNLVYILVYFNDVISLLGPLSQINYFGLTKYFFLSHMTQIQVVELMEVLYELTRSKSIKVHQRTRGVHHIASNQHKQNITHKFNYLNQICSKISWVKKCV